MNWRLLAIVATGLAVCGVVEPAFAAKARKAVRPVCQDQPGGPTFWGAWFNPEPVPNGCTPPVFAQGRFVGQDIDPNIRFQLLRQPQTGYTVTK